MKNKKELLTGFLAIVAVLGFLAALGMLVFGKEIPTTNREYFSLGFGALIGIATMIYNWFFGSSKSSAEKTALLTAREQTPPPGEDVSKSAVPGS